MMNLGESIYRLRTQRNMSQGDLADALEVSRQSVSKWENNSAVPELEKLIKLTEVFGVTIDELVTGSASEPATSAPADAKVIYIERPAKFSITRILGIILFCFSLIFLLLTIFVPGIDEGGAMPLFFSCLLLAAALLFHRSNVAFWICITAWAISWLTFASEGLVIFALSSSPTCVIWIGIRLKQLWREQEKG